MLPMPFDTAAGFAALARHHLLGNVHKVRVATSHGTIIKINGVGLKSKPLLTTTIHIADGSLKAHLRHTNPSSQT